MASLWCICVILVPFLNAILVDAQTFITQPENTTVMEGQTVTEINCKVRALTLNSQLLSFQRGSVIISDGGILRKDVLTGLGLNAEDYGLTVTVEQPNSFLYTLYIARLDRRESSEFRCIVCRSVDLKCDENNIIVESDVATLTVTYQPGLSYPQCSIQSDSGTTQVFLDELITLSCLSEIAVPPVDLAWTKDGKAVAADVSDSGGNRRANVAMTVQVSDDGTIFLCRLTYTGLQNLYKNCSLTAFNVVSNPDIIIDGTSPVVVGDDAVFTCTVSSRTSSIVSSSWIVPDRFKGRYSISEGLVLTITDVQSEDHLETLTCSATDQDGQTAMATQRVLIEGMPVTTPTITTVEPPETTEAPGVSGLLIALLIVGAVVIILLLALSVWCYRKRCYSQDAKKKQAGVSSHVQIPMNNSHQFSAMPDKTPNHKVDGKDYPDDSDVNNPDVIPRERRGDVPDGVDPRKWWRDTMAPTDSTPYEGNRNQENYPTPTIKRMKMPFEDRSSPYENSRMHDVEYSGDHGYDRVADRGYRQDNADFSDSGYREPRHDDYGQDGYEHPQPSRDPQYESTEFQDQGSEDRMVDGYDYDNDAYERSFNGVDQGRPSEPYNDQYSDQYNDRYDDQNDDQYNRQYDDQYDDRYDDRYESYGRPDGQEGYDMPPPEEKGEPYPNYEQDERIPDGHSSSNDHYSAPYDDQYRPGYDDQPTDPYGYERDESRKYDYDEDLRNDQETPSYV